MKLNEAQESAVTFVSGPCLVLAGAGSGKNRALSQKLRHARALYCCRYLHQ